MLSHVILLPEDFKGAHFALLRFNWKSEGIDSLTKMLFSPRTSVEISIGLNSFISRTLISQSGKKLLLLKMWFMILNFITYSSWRKLVG